jgi:hypothetical protein
MPLNYRAIFVSERNEPSPEAVFKAKGKRGVERSPKYRPNHLCVSAPRPSALRSPGDVFKTGDVSAVGRRGGMGGIKCLYQKPSGVFFTRTPRF